MTARLQPLRIPAGWLVSYNNGLWELDPEPALIPNDQQWVFFKEDMMQLSHARANRLLDLSWSPEGDLENGCYLLRLYEGDCRGRLLHEVRTRDRMVLVTEIERLLLAVFHGKL